MKNFKDFGITVTSRNFEGDKIKIDKIINKEIIVKDYKIENSKFQEKGNGKCLYIQILLSGENRVLFSGSGYLMDMIEMVPKDSFPFKATIVRQNERLEFT